MGVWKGLIENSRTLRLPIHMHERQIAIRTTKAKLEKIEIAPSMELMFHVSDSKQRSPQKISSKAIVSNMADQIIIRVGSQNMPNNCIFFSCSVYDFNISRLGVAPMGSCRYSYWWLSTFQNCVIRIHDCTPYDVP